MPKRPTMTLDFLRERTAQSRVLDERLPKKQNKKRRKSWAERKIGTWGGRILGAMSEGGLSAADERYESHQTSQDFIWNTAGLATWGMVFPVLTIIITQLVGAEQAGMFSLAFVAGHLLMFLANYGVRTYQVSDREEAHSFMDYQINRWITCAVMLLAGWIFCTVRGYDAIMQTMTMAVFVYKMIDGMADVYEGRLQQVDKLYLAGMSQTLRSVSVLLIFSAALLFTRSLVVASIAMAVAAVLSLVFFTLPLALLETAKSEPFKLQSLVRLFIHCAPVFLALFLYALIDNMPKFMMEGALSYDNQLYFNALYFPAQTILMTVGFLYKPLLTRMADTWNDVSRRRRFDLLIMVALLVIIAITVIGILLMRWIGIPVMSFLYGIDFEPFRRYSYLMLVAGGITGGIDFLYQVVTVMRRQNVVVRLYLITFVFALVVPYMLIDVSGLEGAVMSYVIVMGILFVLLSLEYIGVRLSYSSRLSNKYAQQASTASQLDNQDSSEAWSARDAVRAERIAREGGELDTRTAARRSLRQREERRSAARQSRLRPVDAKAKRPSVKDK